MEPEKTLEENKILNRDMLSNRERHKLSATRPSPSAMSSGWSPSRTKEILSTITCSSGRRALTPKGCFWSRARGRRLSPSP